MTQSQDAGPNLGVVFQFFTEVGIINQLSTTMLASALPDGVHPSHFAIVNHLARVGDGWTPVRIAAAMQITKMTMTHSLKVLIDHGFIETRPNPADARGKCVFLTNAGKEFHMRALQNAGQMFGGVFNGNHLDIMAALTPDLTALRKHLDENRPKR